MQLQAKVNNPSSFLQPLDTTFLFCSPSLWSNPDATSLCTVLGTQKLEDKQEEHKEEGVCAIGSRATAQRAFSPQAEQKQPPPASFKTDCCLLNWEYKTKCWLATLFSNTTAFCPGKWAGSILITQSHFTILVPAGTQLSEKADIREEILTDKQKRLQHQLGVFVRTFLVATDLPFVSRPLTSERSQDNRAKARATLARSDLFMRHTHHLYRSRGTFSMTCNSTEQARSFICSAQKVEHYIINKRGAFK